MAKKPSSSLANMAVVAALVSKYSALAALTSFTEHDLKELFTEAEIDQINRFLLDMKQAEDANASKARLVANIGTYADGLLALLRKVGGLAI